VNTRKALRRGWRLQSSVLPHVIDSVHQNMGMIQGFEWVEPLGTLQVWRTLPGEVQQFPLIQIQNLSESAIGHVLSPAALDGMYTQMSGMLKCYLRQQGSQIFLDSDHKLSQKRKKLNRVYRPSLP
jgi:hypothetical protein